MDRTGEGEEAVWRQELQVSVRERDEAMHVTASTRECDGVPGGKMHIDVPFDQVRQGEEGGGGSG